MKENIDYVYIMCPVPVSMLKDLPIPFLQPAQPIPTQEDDDFVPLWYGNAKFPEDDT